MIVTNVSNYYWSIDIKICKNKTVKRPEGALFSFEKEKFVSSFLK